MKIACINSLDSLKCVMFRVFNLTALSNEFLDLLRTYDLNIIRSSVGRNIVKIGRGFKCDNATKNLKYITKLGRFTIK